MIAILLQNNNISDISGLKNLKVLTNVNLTNNPIKEEDILDLNNTLPKLSIRIGEKFL